MKFHIKFFRLLIVATVVNRFMNNRGPLLHVFNASFDFLTSIEYSTLVFSWCGEFSENLKDMYLPQTCSDLNATLLSLQTNLSYSDLGTQFLTFQVQ